MNRDAPTLVELILKLVALVPTKCLHNEAKCRLLYEAVNDPAKPCFKDRDIIQEMIQRVIDSGRMTDDAVPVLFFQGRSSMVVSNSKLSGK